MTAGSLQLRQYLRARRNGTPTDIAANEAGIGLVEARLHDKGEAEGEYSNIDTELPHHGTPHSTAPADETADQRESVNGGVAGVTPTLPMVSSGATIGHNSGETHVADIAAEALRLYLERIERLKEEVKGLSADIRDVFNEAKGQGYDVPTMREMLKLRAMDSAKREEKAALVETYSIQLGLL